MLHLGLFALIQEVVGPVEIDLFASCLTHQLPCYYSWRPDPAVEATDPFTQNWSQLWGYVNPSLVSYTSKDPARSCESDNGGPIVEDAAMVAPSPTTVELIPTSDSDAGQHSNISDSGRVHNAGGSFAVGCLATIQHCGRMRGL